MTKEEINVQLASVLSSKFLTPGRRDEAVSRILESLPKGAKILVTEARDIYEWCRVKDDIDEYEESELRFLTCLMTKVYGNSWISYDEDIDQKVITSMDYPSEPSDVLSIVIL